ncbi:N-acetyltransferase family protein [Niallia sp. Sow4_A1]|jgi:GNAT superfamily N-acetyltransferase|uniref:GNAT family N-acetyltransferase n=1 Tax=Niallia hominis TaxID=3133173 RepID=A0ABV1ETR8_9BACI|nr:MULTISPECIES: GNAT family N-acetyltransferase [Bacillaceae]MCF2650013.1 GNAT family N-acetyltransferase [Niallia circulans]CAI9386598.1 Mycothiol acetyltransferase [Bacillus sp. T2.9-1]
MMIRKARSEDAKGIAKVHIDSWRTTYRGIVPDTYLKALIYEEKEEIWKRAILTGSVFVAENEEGQIVGFANGGKERSGQYSGYDGELYAIYLLEAYQGKGIGSSLAKKVFEYLKEKGFNSMIIFALAENPACKFYEAIGGKRIGTEEIEIGGEEFTEVVFGWNLA